MKWIAPYQKDADNDTLERRRWDAADELPASSGLTPSHHVQPPQALPTGGAT